MSKQVEQENGDVPGGRSASFPFIGLSAAIDRAKQLNEAEKQNYARVPRIFEVWQYSEKSSGARQTLAALRAYGLLEFRGKSENRQARVSERALRIIHNAPDAARQICEAALEAHSDLWGTYSQTWPPSDETVRDRLLWELKVKDTPEEALSAARQFKETAEFAKLPSLAKMPSDLQNINADSIKNLLGQFDPTRPHGSGEAIRGQSLTALPTKGSGMKTDVSTIGEHEASLSWPASLTQDEFDDMKYWLEGIIRKAQRDISKGPAQGPASDPEKPE